MGKKCQIEFFEGGVKHRGVKTNTVLSISYVQKRRLVLTDIELCPPTTPGKS